MVLIWLGRTGLLLDLIGACLLWRGGTPPVYRPSYSRWAPKDYNPEKEEADWNVKAARWERLNMIGVALLVAGFAMQLIGTWGAR